MPDQPNLLTEEPWKLMRKLSLPGVLGMMVLSINSLMDSVYVGNMVSTEAFAGVSLLFPLTLVVTSVTGFIAAGSSSVLSRAIGSGNLDVQRKVIPNMIALAVLVSIPLMTVGWVFSAEMVTLMGAVGAVHQAAVDYMQVYLFGVFFSVYGLSANGLIRSEGKVRQAMTYTVIAVLINLVLTPLFIDFLGLGIGGAAWSSIASMLVYSLLTSLYFIRGKASFFTGGFGIRVEVNIIRDVSAIGFSSLSMQLSNVVRQLIVFRSVTYYGSAHDLAIFSAAFRLFSFISVPAMGLLQPLQPMMGVNYGAAKWERCIQAVGSFRLGGILLMGILLLPMMLFPEWFISLIIPSESMSRVELNHFRLIFLALPFLPVSTSAIIYFQAVGESKKASLLPLARQFLLFLPLILLLPYVSGVSGVYYTLTLENILYAMFMWFITKAELQKLEQKILLT